jgi:hypothetical protein
MRDKMPVYTKLPECNFLTRNSEYVQVDKVCRLGNSTVVYTAMVSYSAFLVALVRSFMSRYTKA